MAADEVAAKEYIKFLMNSNESFSKCLGNPISIDAYRSLSTEKIDLINMEFELMLEYGNKFELNTWGYFKYDDSSLENYIQLLKSAKTVSVIDPNIRLIVTEEILPYVAGQRLIEDVGKIIENRAQTVIDERG